MALWVLHHRPHPPGSIPANGSGNGIAPEQLQPLNALDFAGALIFTAGLYIEHTADMQKTA